MILLMWLLLHKISTLESIAIKSLISGILSFFSKIENFLFNFLFLNTSESIVLHHSILTSTLDERGGMRFSVVNIQCHVNEAGVCSICRNMNRNFSRLAIIERDFHYSLLL